MVKSKASSVDIEQTDKQTYEQITAVIYLPFPFQDTMIFMQV